MWEHWRKRLFLAGYVCEGVITGKILFEEGIEWLTDVQDMKWKMFITF